MLFLQDQLFGWLHLWGIGPAAGCGCKSASVVLWGTGEGGWLWPHFRLFHFKVQSFVGDSCAVSYVFASCCWLHMFRAVVSCVLRQWEADENAPHLASKSVKLGWGFFPYFFQREDKVLLLHIHTCFIFPSKYWTLLLKEVKPVTLERLPKLPDLFEMQLIIKKEFKLCKIRLLTLFKGMSGAKTEMPLAFHPQVSL